MNTPSFLFNWEGIQKFFTLSISLAGTIAIPIIIWWFSSYKANKDKEEENQIKALNCIYADLYRISNSIVEGVELFTEKYILSKEALLYLETPIDSFNWKIYNNKFNTIRNPFLTKFSLKYSKLDITFISLNAPYLYRYLYSIEDRIDYLQSILDELSKRTFRNADKRDSSIKSTNEKLSSLYADNKETLNKEGLLHFNKESIMDEKRLVLSIYNNNKKYIDTFDNVISLIKITIPELEKYIDNNFSHKVSLHSKPHLKFLKRILEYKNEAELIDLILENLLLKNFELYRGRIKEYDTRFGI